MLCRCTRLALVVSVVFALPLRADAQFDPVDFSAPDPFLVSIETAGANPADNTRVGACGIVAPSWPEALLVDCEIDGTPTALRVWKGQPVAGGTPAATFPFGGGQVSVPNPTANLLHLMEEGMLVVEVLGATGTLGQGQIVRPRRQSFTRVSMNGAGHQPANETTATRSCDLLLLEESAIIDGVVVDAYQTGFFDCTHNVPNAQFGQVRRGSPNGPILIDFSNQLPNPRQQGLFPIPAGMNDFLDGEVFVVVDESLEGARVAGQATCWNGAQSNGGQAICLNGGRFKADVDWMNANGQTGPGTGGLIGPAGDAGLFYFADPNNWELLVKVIDACDQPGFNNFWVFAAGLTNVEVTMTVTDTQTNVSKSYMNPLGTPFQPITDTQAFATCP